MTSHIPQDGGRHRRQRRALRRMARGHALPLRGRILGTARDAALAALTDRLRDLVESLAVEAREGGHDALPGRGSRALRDEIDALTRRLSGLGIDPGTSALPAELVGPEGVEAVLRLTEALGGRSPWTRAWRQALRDPGRPTPGPVGGATRDTSPARRAPCPELPPLGASVEAVLFPR